MFLPFFPSQNDPWDGRYIYLKPKWPLFGKGLVWVGLTCKNRGHWGSRYLLISHKMYRSSHGSVMATWSLSCVFCWLQHPGFQLLDSGRWQNLFFASKNRTCWGVRLEVTFSLMLVWFISPVYGTFLQSTYRGWLGHPLILSTSRDIPLPCTDWALERTRLSIQRLKASNDWKVPSIWGSKHS